MNTYMVLNKIIKDGREGYKADRIISWNNYEVILLKCSGPYLNDKKQKLSFDFHKAMFGLLAMVYDIAWHNKYLSSMITPSEL